MLNSTLLKNRLAQYGVAWLTAFILGLGITLAAPHRVLVMQHWADLYLPIAFAALGLAIAANLVIGLLSREPPLVKLVLLLLTLVLALPLFWAPVLGVVTTAALTNAAIEYSEVYVAFRTVIGNMIFPITQMLFQGALWDSVWKTFQWVSTLVGGLVSLYQGWGILRNLMTPRRQMEPDIEAYAGD